VSHCVSYLTLCRDLFIVAELNTQLSCASTIAAYYFRSCLRLVQLFKEDLRLEHQLSCASTKAAYCFRSCLRLVQLFKQDLRLEQQLSCVSTIAAYCFRSCLRLVQLFKEDLRLEHQLSCARQVFFMEAGDLMHEFCSQAPGKNNSSF
jgi:hypothetical protein